MEGICRALFLFLYLVLIAGTAIEQAPSVGPRCFSRFIHSFAFNVIGSIKVKFLIRFDRTSDTNVTDWVLNR